MGKLVSRLGLLVFLASETPSCEAFSNPNNININVNNEVAFRQRQQQQQSSSSSSKSTSLSLSSSSSSRRDLFQKTAASIVGVTGALVLPGGGIVAPQPAYASGGATAGKYTSIPIAKRRYYGRVQASVHEFLLLGPDVVKADFSAATIQTFFDPMALVVVAAKIKDGKEIRDSYYNDMKTSMYLLGNAFRLNQTKAPDNLPTVRAAKTFFKEMDFVEKAAKRKRQNDRDTVIHYAAALEALDKFLDLVELPPTDTGWYDKEFSRAVGNSARIT